MIHEQTDMPIDFQCERKVWSLSCAPAMPGHIWCGEAVRAQQSRLQQLLRQPISCFLKLDVTVHDQHCIGPFSQHKAMMGRVFSQGRLLPRHIYAIYDNFLYFFFKASTAAIFSAFSECFTSLNLACCGLDNMVFNSKTQLVHLSLPSTSIWL